jgi:hypothetical protein
MELLAVDVVHQIGDAGEACAGVSDARPRSSLAFTCGARLCARQQCHRTNETSRLTILTICFTKFVSSQFASFSLHRSPKSFT